MSAASRPGPWRRLERARPLVAWSTAQLAALARVLQAAQQAWREAWGLPAEEGGVTCRPATAQDLEGCWQSAGSGQGGTAWIAPERGAQEAIERALWGGEREPGPIARSVASACGADGLLRLRAALRIEDPIAGGITMPPPGCAWSGQVCATLAGHGHLLLDAALVQATLHSAAPGLAQRTDPAAGGTALTPVHSALAAVRLPLQARLADCELDLASLQDLRIGDVVPLPHRLDAPLLVRDARDEVLFGGYLARQGQCKALELAALSSPSR